MTRAQIKAVACALFHDGIDVDKLSDTAKDELRKAVEILLAAPSPSSPTSATRPTCSEVRDD